MIDYQESHISPFSIPRAETSGQMPPPILKPPIVDAVERMNKTENQKLIVNIKAIYRNYLEIKAPATAFLSNSEKNKREKEFNSLLEEVAPKQPTTSTEATTSPDKASTSPDKDKNEKVIRLAKARNLFSELTLSLLDQYSNNGNIAPELARTINQILEANPEIFWLEGPQNVLEFVMKTLGNTEKLLKAHDGNFIWEELLAKASESSALPEKLTKEAAEALSLIRLAKLEAI